MRIRGFGAESREVGERAGSNAAEMSGRHCLAEAHFVPLWIAQLILGTTPQARFLILGKRPG